MGSAANLISRLPSAERRRDRIAAAPRNEACLTKEGVMTTETLTQPERTVTRSALTHLASSLRPSFIRGEILQAHYDDLLTAGLGREGLERLTAETLPRFASSA